MTDADVLIIGGGIAGASCAYHLTERDIDDVLALEKQHPGSGATGQSAGFITPYQFLGTGIHATVNRYCASFFEELASPSNNLDLHYREAFTLARREESVPHVRKLHEETEWSSEFLTEESLSQRLAPIVADEILAAVGFENGMFLDPYSAATTMLEAATNQGATCEIQTVTGIERAGEEIAVTTNETEYRAPHVIVASGAWSKALTAEVVGVPLKPRISQIAMIQTDNPVTLPLVNDPDLDLYYRTEVDGDVLIGGGIDKEELDPTTFDEQATESFLQEVSEKAGQIVPELGRGRVSSSWAGLCSATPDRNPLVGETDVPGLILCCGFNGEGVMYSPMAGQIIADLVTGVDSPFERSHYDPKRYDDEVNFEIKSALEW